MIDLQIKTKYQIKYTSDFKKNYAMFYILGADNYSLHILH